MLIFQYLPTYCYFVTKNMYINILRQNNMNKSHKSLHYLDFSFLN